MAKRKKVKKGKKREKKGKFPYKHCTECQSKNIHYSKMEDKVFCRDCGAIMVRS